MILRKVGKRWFSKGSSFNSKRSVDQFVKRSMEANEKEQGQIFKEIKRCLKKNHFQGKLQRMSMWILTNGQREKEDKVDEEFFKLVFEPQYSVQERFELMKEDLVNSSLVDNLKAKIPWERIKGNRDELMQKYDQIEQKELKEKFVSNFGLYNESIQALVEGQREVMHNPEHVLENGETVKENVSKFRSRLRKLLDLASMNISKKIQEEKDKFKNKKK